MKDLTHIVVRWICATDVYPDVEQNDVGDVLD